jgi:hypothetical protein
VRHGAGGSALFTIRAAKLAAVAITVLASACSDGVQPTSASAPPTEVTEALPPTEELDAPEATEELDELGAIEELDASLPDVTGLDYADARAELRELGLDVRREAVSSAEDKHLVIEQDPEPGAALGPGTVVVLTVSDGSADPPASSDSEPATTTRPPTAGDLEPVRPLAANLPNGLFCRDLAARGYNYAEAVWYWDVQGRPSRMDASGNGIPCQTVYPRAEVDAYWGVLSPVYDLPSGLFCRDLAARGYSYAEAVWYWSLEGYPDRMDASGNGIPCQTVYPRAEVAAYWR